MEKFTIKRGDTSPSIAFDLMSGGAAVDLTGAAVKFIMANKINAAATIEDAVAGTVRYDWQAGDTAVTGAFKAEFEVTFPGGLVETFPNAEYILVEILADLG